jgi:hypothetical protein
VDYSSDRASLDIAMQSVSYVLITELQMDTVNGQVSPPSFDFNGFRRCNLQPVLGHQKQDEYKLKGLMWNPESLNSVFNENTSYLTVPFKLPEQAMLKAADLSSVDKHQTAQMIHEFILKGMHGFGNTDPFMTQLEVLELHSTTGGALRSCMAYPDTKVRVTTVSVKDDALKVAIEAHVHLNQAAFTTMNISCMENVFDEMEWPTDAEGDVPERLGE